MKRIIGILFLIFLISLMTPLLFLACGGDDGEGERVELTTCRPPEPVPTQPAGDLPPGVAEYQSPERAYRARYPEGWDVKPGGVAFQNIAGDVFFAPAEEGEVKPNVTVTCETIPVGTSTEAFFEAKQVVIERVVGTRPELSRTLTVDGEEAFLVEYPVRKEQTPEPLNIDKIEVFFADDLGGWTIALVVPEGMVEEYRAAFEDFVDGFDRLQRPQ